MCYRSLWRFQLTWSRFASFLLLVENVQLVLLFWIRFRKTEKIKTPTPWLCPLAHTILKEISVCAEMGPFRATQVKSYSWGSICGWKIFWESKKKTVSVKGILSIVILSFFILVIQETLILPTDASWVPLSEWLHCRCLEQHFPELAICLWRQVYFQMVLPKHSRSHQVGKLA
jgi:hypothetical protein